jgi:hypothetical protein
VTPGVSPANAENLSERIEATPRDAQQLLQQEVGEVERFLKDDLMNREMLSI